MTDLVFVDCETTGLDPDLHEIWEIAYAVNDGPVIHNVVPHQLETADPKALKMNGYWDRGNWGLKDKWGENFDLEVREALDGNTLVGANPAFDAAFLRKRWGVDPWSYRMIDVESMALGILEYERPRGLAGISEDLQLRGYPITEPNHSAHLDVVVLRDCYKALRDIQLRWRRDRALSV